MKKLLLLSLSAIFLTGCTMGGISIEQAQTVSDDFIKTVLAPGAEINVKSVEKVGGDFKITVEAQGQEVVSYLSSDGTIFYPQGLNIAELKTQMAEAKKAQEAAPAVEGKEAEATTETEEATTEQIKEETPEDTKTPAE